MNAPSTSTGFRIEFPNAGRPRRYLTAASAPSTDRGRARLFSDRAAAELALRHLPAPLRATAVIVAAE